MDALLERFCRYVKIETTADENAESYPSSRGQLELGKLLVAELGDLNLKDVSISPDGIVMATISGNAPGAPTIAWFAHLDTSPETSGANVNPIVHHNYDGLDITLTGDPTKIIRVADTEGLAALAGKTLITADGTTLLGADDKAGIAIIMTAADHLMAHPDAKRGDIRVVFTCDEEIGHGTDKVDLAKVGAVVGYTLDGEAACKIENETFSADLAVVTITGRNIHPAIAKDKMINAVKLAGEYLAHLPMDSLAPELTDGRDGFVHPYVIEGGVARVTIRILLRSFVTADLADQADLLRSAARCVQSDHPGAQVTVDVKKQYRNMIEALESEPRAVDLAAQATRNLGHKPQFESIRGGTDGSRFSELGLPTPNLSAGMYNFHSPLEFACLNQMQTSVDILVELAKLWSEQK